MKYATGQAQARDLLEKLMRERFPHSQTEWVPSDVIGSLFSDDPEERWEAAAGIHMPSIAMQEFLFEEKQDDEHALWGLIANPYTDPRILTRFVNHLSENVRMILTWKHNLQLDDLKALADDSSEEVAKSARENLAKRGFGRERFWARALRRSRS